MSRNRGCEVTLYFSGKCVNHWYGAAAFVSPGFIRVGKHRQLERLLFVLTDRKSLGFLLKRLQELTIPVVEIRTLPAIDVIIAGNNAPNGEVRKKGTLFPEKIRLAPTGSRQQMDRRDSGERDCPRTEKSARNPSVRLRDLTAWSVDNYRVARRARGRPALSELGVKVSLHPAQALRTPR